MKILVTGSAGFIGFHLSKRLVKEGYDIIGFDNINDYYSTELKYDRLRQLGITREYIIEGDIVESTEHKNFKFVKADLENREVLKNNSVLNVGNA